MHDYKDKYQIFQEGITMFADFLEARGFRLVTTESHEDKEGVFQLAHFQKGNRRLDVAFLYGLSGLTYSIGDCNIEHEMYMKKLGARNAYPGFSSDPLDAFRHAISDLQAYCGDFLSGPGEDFSTFAREAMDEIRQANTSIARAYTSEMASDRQLCRTARQLFAQKHYTEIVQIERKLHYPEDLTDSERLIFRKAQERAQT